AAGAVVAGALIVDHEGLLLGRALPEVPVEGGRRLAGVARADGGTGLVTEAAGHVDLAEDAVADLLHGFDDGGVAADLRAVLDDPVVLAGGVDELAPLPHVVGAGLLDVDVLAGLAGPDGRQRVPVVRGGD